MAKTEDQAKEDMNDGTIVGRSLYQKEKNAANGMRIQADEKAAINAQLQGSEADIIKKAMIDINTFLNKELPQTKMIMQVHDELVFDVDSSEIDLLSLNIKKIMEGTIDHILGIIVKIKGDMKNTFKANLDL